ncbi:hypothetical protein D3C71_920880 [compost metagenome]
MQCRQYVGCMADLLGVHNQRRCVRVLRQEIQHIRQAQLRLIACGEHIRHGHGACT